MHSTLAQRRAASSENSVGPTRASEGGEARHVHGDVKRVVGERRLRRRVEGDGELRQRHRHGERAAAIRVGQALARRADPFELKLVRVAEALGRRRLLRA